MRHSVLAVALLLATAPIAGATEITPETKPEMRVVEVAAPSVRTNVAVAPAHAEARTTKPAAAQQMNTTTLVILVLAVIGALVIIGAVL